MPAPPASVKRPRVMPEGVRTAADPIEPALWLGQRIRRFQPIVGHPWFSAIFGKMVAGMSTWRIAQWLWVGLPADDPLKAIGFDPLYSRLKRFRKLMPDGVLAARSYLDEKFAAVGAGIDELEEMDTLIRYQKGRISAKAEQEAAFPVPIEQMRREIAELASLLQLRRDTAVMFGLHPNARLVENPAAQEVKVTVSPDPVPTIDAMIQARPDLVGRWIAVIEELDDLQAEATRPRHGAPTLVSNAVP